jgi:hypothetical protein
VIITRRLWARAACVVLTSVLVGVVAAAVAGCGATAVASPEHLGTWEGSAAGTKIAIAVAGTPGHYTAQETQTGSILYATSASSLTLSFSGGQADEQGHITFPTTKGQTLTLGPVSGNQMTAYLGSTTEDWQAAAISARATSMADALAGQLNAALLKSGVKMTKTIHKLESEAIALRKVAKHPSVLESNPKASGTASHTSVDMTQEY